MRIDDQCRLNALDRAVSRYARTLRQGQHCRRSDGNESEQVSNFRRAAERAELRAAQLRETLNAYGILPIQHVAYRSFTLHLDKLIRNHSGTTLLSLAQSAVDYWTAYGLKPEVLARICKEVFGLGL